MTSPGRSLIRGGRLPVFVLVPALAGLALVVVPLLALLPKVEWSTFTADITDPVTRSALWLSVRTGAIATLCCVLLGVPLALLVSRCRNRWATVLRTIVTLPLVLPPLVGGVALLAVLGRTGLFGPALESVGVNVPFTPAAVVVAQAFVAMPFLVISVEGALRSVGQDYEHVAAGLGARPWRILTRITLPLIAPGLLAGIVLCFARAVGEFGATALLAGNKPGVTQTIPMAIYTAFNGAGVSQSAALALSVLLIATALVVLLVFPAARGASGRVTRTRRRRRPVALPGRDPGHVEPGAGAELGLDVAAALGDFRLSVDLSLPAGHVLALVGENGAGKTTLLRLIAGTLAPTRGWVRLGGRELSRGGSKSRLLPPERRRIGMLTQDATLFPHLSATENVAFGPRSTGTRARTAAQEATAWLARVGLAGAGDRFPHELSGGQQQRIALARALATRPELLLLDEPLAALDVATAPRIRRLLAEEIRRSGVTAVVVTHHALDAIVLADDVAVLARGRLVEHGPAAEVFAAPRTPFAATLAGLGLLTSPETGELLRVHPAHVRLDPATADDAAGGATGEPWLARVVAVEPSTAGARVHLSMDDGARLAADLSPAQAARYLPGDRVRVFLDGASVLN